MHKRAVLLLITLLTLFGLTACSTTTINDEPGAQFQNYSANQLYVTGNKALAAHDYDRAIRLYEALQSLYPFGEKSRQGQLNLIYAYFKSGDYASAVSTAQQYTRVYPRSKHIDYIYYMEGLSQLYSGETWLQRHLPINMALRDLSTDKQAFYQFRDLLQRFPDSPYAADARQHMIYLRNRFAQHELEVAQYYMKRQAYVAAANRASYLVHHYQHTPQVKKALVILVKANRRLGLKQSAEKALHTLKINFPHSKQLQRLK